MAEDRLEKALEEMRHEDVDAVALDAARARVRATLAGSGATACAEFRADLGAYASGAYRCRHQARCLSWSSSIVGMR